MIKFGNPTLPELSSLNKEFNKILTSRQITNADYVKKLEKEVARISGVRYAIATNSGTNALILLLKSSGIKGIIGMPAFTWNSCKLAVDWLGYKIRYIDINKNTWLLNDGADDIDLLMPTHTFGSKEFYDTDCPIIYDAAHCLGLPNLNDSNPNLKSSKHNNVLGSIISLSPTKAITGIEGGLILTDSNKIAKKAIEFRRYMGRLEEFNAMIALENLKNYKSILLRKKQLYDYYKENLYFMKFQEILKTSSYNEIGCLLKNGIERNKMENALKDKMEIRRRYNPEGVKLPNTQYIWDRLLMLPSYLSVDETEVVETIKRAYNEIKS